MSKYNAVKTEIDGHVFASKKEAARYSELKLLERAGKIANLRLQPKYQILEDYTNCGKKKKGINYIADFEYYDTEKNTLVIEDTKGFKTDVYKLKKKLFEYHYPFLTITEL